MRTSARSSFSSSQPRLSRKKLYAAMLVATHWLMSDQVWAAPEGGRVVGGQGSISQTGNDTLIHQASERMAIDWRSFDVDKHERVEFIQPNASSLALNRVLSNNASQILGRIDSNGQVILVNSHGIVFGKDAVINVGGMIASGLTIDPESFINGDYTFNSLEGTAGKVINHGLINAAVGGSVTLMGQQVQNDGLISAKLGAVNLAAGHEAVLTFDASGLVGVKVSEAVLQDELGLDPAVLNTGKVTAEGGRVLLTASTSHDVFSSAVNNDGMNKESSVVLHDDGSFTLGAGADVLNAGEINTSVDVGDAGHIVLLGNNVTSSGDIAANSNRGSAGAIELQSKDTTLLIENSMTSAQASLQGKGGDIKVLGNKVGVADHSQINASGAQGGGQVLIGGDKTGSNAQIPNADYIYLRKDTLISTDALINGDGGKLITFAQDTARIYGKLSSRGGGEGGNGGFIETSGLKGFDILQAPDITASAGRGGTWLIDPYNLVVNNSTDKNLDNNGNTVFTSIGEEAILRIGTLQTALNNNATVIIQTGSGENSTDEGNITWEKSASFNITGEATLRLLAHNDIDIDDNIISNNGLLNLELIANKDGTNNGGSITVKPNVTIKTNGGYFYAGKSKDEINGLLGDDKTNEVVNFTSTGATINTYHEQGGGDIFIRATGDVNLGVVEFDYDFKSAEKPYGSDLQSTNNLKRVGSVTIESGKNVTLNSEIDFNNTGKRKNSGDNGYADNLLDDEDTFLDITAGNNITINALISDEGYGDARDAFNITLKAGNEVQIKSDIYTAGGNFLAITKNFNSAGVLINTDRANSNTNDQINNQNGGIPNGNAQWSNGGNVTILVFDNAESNKSSVITLGDIVTDGNALYGNKEGKLHIGLDRPQDVIVDDYDVTLTQTGSLNIAGQTIFDVGTQGSITLTNINNNFEESLSIASAKDVSLHNALLTNLDKVDISGNFTLNSNGITQVEGKNITVGGTSTFIATTDKSILLNDTQNKFDGAISVSSVKDLSIVSNNNLSINSIVAKGGINLVAGTSENKEIHLFGNLTNDSGADSESSGNLSIKGNVVLNKESIHLDAKNNNIVIDGSLTQGSSGDINAYSLQLSGKEIEVGELGSSSGSNNSIALNVTASDFFISDDIFTKGGNVEITAGNLIDVQTINTSADSAGKITLFVNGTGEEETITINGDLNANNTLGGQNDIVLTLEGTSAKGFINLNNDSFFSSNVQAKGLGINDTLEGFDLDSTWQITGERKGTISSAHNTILGNVSFEGMEVIKGGSQDDAFIVKDNAAFKGLIIGGSGTDLLNLADSTNDSAFEVVIDEQYQTESSFTLSGLETIIGNDHSETKLRLVSGTNEWIIDDFDEEGGISDGLNDGTINGIQFIDFKNLIGGEGVDTFTIEKDFSGLIEGRDGNDIFNLKAQVQKILGGNGDDRFVFYKNGSVVQSGGSHGNGGDNVIDFVNIDGAYTVNAFGNSSKVQGISGISLVIGNNNNELKLASSNGTSTWRIFDFDGDGDRSDGLNDGTLGDVKFVNFKNLQGGNGNDTFHIETEFDGTISGGNGDDQFVFYDNGSVENATGGAGTNVADFSNITTAKTVTLNGSSINNVADINRIIGNQSDSLILAGSAGANNWTIADFEGASGINAGTVNGIQFIDFKYLQGGSDIDTFTINKSFVGTIDGGAGADIFNVNATVTHLLGGEGIDTFTLDAVVESIEGGNGNDTFHINVAQKAIDGGAGNDTFNIKATVDTILGGDGNDVFHIETATTSITGGNGDDQFVFYNNGSVGSATGGAGTNVADFSNITTAKTVTLNGSSVNNIANINRIIGNQSDTLILAGSAGANNWTIADFEGASGINAGTVNGIQFIDFKYLQGSGGVDTFTINQSFVGTIDGGAGDDNFNVNATVTHLLGGEGIDTFTLDAVVESIEGGNGNDTFHINVAQKAIDGGAGNDTFNIKATADTILGGGGNDVFHIETATTSITAGDGDDQFVFYNNGSVGNATGGAGTNVADFSNITTAKTVTLNGSSVNNIANINRIIGNQSDTLILAASAGANNWTIADFEGASGINAGTVNGIQFIDFKYLQGSGGVDTFTINKSFVGTIDGGAGADIFNVNASVTHLLGGEGIDTFTLDAVVESIEGGNGNDTFHINVAQKAIDGGAGNDTFNIKATVDTILGGDGNDVFHIETATTSITGGDGDDQFVFYNNGSVGNATGGAGTNVADFSHITTAKTVTLNGSSINNVADINRIIGNQSDSLILVGSAGANNWTIADFEGASGINAGTVNGIQFIDFKYLQGSGGVDTFTINKSFVGTIDGGADNDVFTLNALVNSLVGGSGNDTFHINVAQKAIDGGAGNDTFNIKATVDTILGGDGNDVFHIETATTSITGGNGDDKFVFYNNGSVGNATGGAGTNVADFSNITTAKTVTLNGSSVNNIANINRIIGNQSDSLILAASAGANNWTIADFEGASGINAGTVNDIQFIDFKSLQGGSDIDTFTINKSFVGTIDGGASADIFNVNASVTHLLGGDGNDQFILGSVGSATSVDGGEGDNTLVGRNSATTWTLTAADVGRLSTGNTTYLSSFSKIQTLQGGSGVDIFDLQFTFSGIVKGGAGDDIFNINAKTNSLYGEAGNDNFLFNSPSNVGSAVVIDGGQGDNAITGRETITTWTISSANAGKVDTTSGPSYVNAFTNIQRLNGGSAADDFNINASIKEINAGAGNNTFYINTNVGQLNGGVNNDHFILGASGVAQSINGGGGINTLTARDQNNNWSISGAHAGSLSVTGGSLYVENFTHIQNLMGGKGTDKFYINALAGNLYGNEGDDEFIFSSNNNAGSAVLIDGGLGNNLLIGRNADNKWTMTGVGSGQLSTADAQTYAANFTAIQRIQGGSSIDSLVGVNQDNYWIINGLNTGQLENASALPMIRFSNMENLVGNRAIDTFRFTSTQSHISGLIDGGSSLNLSSIIDSLDVSVLTNGVTVDLGNSVSSALKVTNIESITAYDKNPSANVIIGASDTAYFWNITALNTGTIERASSPVLEQSVSFNHFGDLLGGVNDDKFNILAQVSKSIHGGDGNGLDMIDYSSRTEDVKITIGGNGSLGSTGINGIEGILGNGGKDSLYKTTINVQNGHNTWTIGAFNDSSDGLNDGTINVNGKIISFENVNHLIGGTGNDTFVYSSLGQLIGTIDGGAGNNTIDARLAAKEQQFHVNGTLTGVTNIKDIQGISANASVNNILVSQNHANTWIIDNKGLGRLNNTLGFSGFTNLTGGNFIDVFNIDNIAGLTGIIDGGGAADRVNLSGVTSNIRVGFGKNTKADIRVSNIETLEANPATLNTLMAENLNKNSWEITAQDTGSLNSQVAFSGFANLIGGTRDDSFSFIGNNALISGLIDGGSGQDIVDLTLGNPDMVIRVGINSNSDQNSDLHIKNIETLTGGMDANHRLIAGDVDNLWKITSKNTGQLTESESSVALSFNNIKHLTGGNQNDSFTFEAEGQVTGFIDGGVQRDFDIVDVSKSVNPHIVITAQGAASGYTNIEKFVGNAINSSITGANIVNHWLIQNDQGTINGSITFEGFVSLIGGNQQDIFQLENTALSGAIHGLNGDDSFTLTNSSVEGGIYGGAGNDLFTISVGNGFANTLDIQGGSGRNRLIMSGGNANYQASHQPDVLKYTSSNNRAYTINYTDFHEITDNVVAHTLSLWGTSDSDLFRLQNNKYTINDQQTVNYAQKKNLVINGSSDDQVSIIGDLVIPDTLRITNATVNTENNSSITAQSLELVSTQGVGSESERLQTRVDNIYLRSINGDVYLEEQDALDIKEFSTLATGVIDLIVGNTLSASTELKYAGQLNLMSRYEDIQLDRTNQLTGKVGLKAAGAVTLSNNASLALKDVSAQQLTLNIVGAITSQGPVVVTGLTDISSTSSVSLLHADNDFNAVSVRGAKNVSLHDKNSLRLTGVTALGDVSVTARESIDITAACAGPCGDNLGMKASNIDIRSEAGAITLEQAIEADGRLDFNSQGAVINQAISANDIVLNAGRGNLLMNELGNLTGTGEGVIELKANAIDQRTRITNNGTVTLRAAQNIHMANNSLTESAAGNVEYEGTNIALARINAVNGGVITRAQGSISDNNGNEININAGRWDADAVAGIGAGRLGSAEHDAIETDIQVLSARNLGKPLNDGKINILNTGSLRIEQLRNNGDISIANLSGDFVLDNSHNEPFNINDGDARTQGGVINAGTHGGILSLSIPEGMVRAENKAVKSNPDIIADIALFAYAENTRYSFGERDRKIVMHIPSFYKQTAGTSSIIWHLKKPLDSADTSKHVKNLMSNDQLIQIEGLSDINPAVFTNVNNYMFDEVALLMPADQRYDDDEYAE